MKTMLIAVLISSGLMAEGVVNCVDYGGGIIVCTDEDGESTTIIQS